MGDRRAGLWGRSLSSSKECASGDKRPVSRRRPRSSAFSDSLRCSGSIIGPFRCTILLRAPSSPSNVTCNVTPKENASILNGLNLAWPPPETRGAPVEPRTECSDSSTPPVTTGTLFMKLPWCSCKSSGGRKPIVPHMVIRSADVTTFASPKSVSLASSRSDMRMFSGFTSRNTIFSFRCRCANASPAWPMYFAATAGFSPRDRPLSSDSHSTRFRSVGQSSSRSAKNRLKENARSRCTMKGWSARRRASTSEVAWNWCCFSCNLSANLRGSLARNHKLLERCAAGSSTSITRPKPPRPSSRTRRSAPSGTPLFLSSCRANIRRDKEPAARETTRALTDLGKQR
mmetsp:Transcript_72569/g.224349  ORF Transcript_72569/g.224349 Transcript_72569/m.224349 type:complete len:344 (-) Transcript_72569:54-1085(-)